MENPNQKPKPDGSSEKSDQEKIEDQKKKSRLAERKGQRPAFPFKRRGP